LKRTQTADKINNYTPGKNLNTIISKYFKSNVMNSVDYTDQEDQNLTFSNSPASKVLGKIRM